MRSQYEVEIEKENSKERETNIHSGGATLASADLRRCTMMMYAGVICRRRYAIHNPSCYTPAALGLMT